MKLIELIKLYDHQPDGKRSQFTIDWIQDKIEDIRDSMETPDYDEAIWIGGTLYEVENLLGIMDKNLFDYDLFYFLSKQLKDLEI